MSKQPIDAPSFLVDNLEKDMRRSQLEPFLKTINPGLRVIRHSNRGEHIYHGGSDAVFFYHNFIGAVPPGDIYLRGTDAYNNGKYRHRSLRGIINKLAVKGVILPHNRRRAYVAAS